MKALNEQELMMTAGGSGKGTVDINVSLHFNGRAAEAIANVSEIPFTFHYGEKSVSSKILRENNWSEDIIQVPKGVEFWCELDFSPWPTISDFKFTWDKANNQIHYEVY